MTTQEIDQAIREFRFESHYEPADLMKLLYIVQAIHKRQSGNCGDVEKQAVIAPQLSPRDILKNDITAVLNKHSVENESQTPDFILAEYLCACLDAWNGAVGWRGSWRNEPLTSNEAVADEIKRENAAQRREDVEEHKREQMRGIAAPHIDESANDALRG